MNILQRYILKESVAPFLLGIFIFTFIFLFDMLFELVDKLVGKGLTVILAAKLLAIIIPSFLVLTVPMAVLIATQLSLGRLAADNEINAIRSSGCNIFQLLLPLLLCGALLAGGMLYFNNTVLPSANYKYRRLMFDAVHQRSTAVIKERTFIDFFDDYILYTSKLNRDNGMMEGVHVYRVDAKHRSVQTAFSRFGKIITDEDKLSITLKLLDGVINWTSGTDLAGFNTILFKTYDINLDVNRALYQQQREQQGSREMTLGEIDKKMADPSTTDRYRHILRYEYHRRFAMPFACIAVVLIGAPMGILSRRSGVSGFFISLFIIFAYYIFMAIGEAVSQKGIVHPLIGCWLPNVSIAAVGIILTLQATREHPLVYYLPAPLRRLLTRKGATL